MPTYNTNYGAKRAREAREQFGLDDSSPVPCVVTLAEERARLPVVVGRLPDHVAGALWRNGVGAIVWVNAVHSVERQRFTIAHELGHVGCRHADITVDTTATISGHTHEPREVQANAFAAELLAPRAGVKALVERDPGLEDLVRLAAHFGISTVAALYRCSTLGLASSQRYNQLRREIDEDLHREIWDYLQPEKVPDALSQIEDYPRVPDSLAGSALAALLRGEVSVDAAAHAAGCSVDTLGAAAADLGR
jgi:Zn-dependent peptidase ImmA (M78 family)